MGDRRRGVQPLNPVPAQVQFLKEGGRGAQGMNRRAEVMHEPRQGLVFVVDAAERVPIGGLN